MRKILLFVFLLFFIDFSFSQLITNGNFENWQVVNYYEIPDDWFIINDIDNANNLAEKSFDAQQGLISVKLNTIATQDDTLFGLVMYGEANDGIFKGKPFSQLGDNFHFWYKSNLSSGDMGMMLMMLYKNGVVLDSIVYIFNSNQVYWTEIILPVNPLQIQPDSMFLTFLSSIPEDFGGTPKPGSWLMIDNMYFTLGGNPTPLILPNYSFESWSMTSTEEALPWVSSNAQNNLLINDVVNVVKTNISNTGNYAAELSTVNISGVKTIGNLQYSESINYQPEKLNLFYKFIPDGVDTAFINIVFFKNQNAIGGAYYEIFNQDLNFVELNIDLNYTDYPDEFNLSILNGKNQGSVLILDDVHFDCIKPQHFYAEFSSSTTALLSWDNGGFEDEWQIQWGLEGFALGTGTHITVSNQTSYSLTGIDEISKYDLYIRSVCGIGDTSSWVGPFTLCKSTNVPYIMDFENTPFSEVPSCWYSYDNNSSQVFTSNLGYAYNGSKYLYVRINNNLETTIFTSPHLYNEISQLYVSFYASKANWAYHSEVLLGTMSNPSDPTTFNQVSSFNLNDSYQNFSYYFGNYVGTDSFIAFKFITNDSNAEIFLDSITIDLLPICIPPSNITVSNVNINSASINWQAGNNESLWHLVYGEEGFNPDTEGIQVNDLLLPSYNLTSLLSSTTYDVYVKADCGGGQLSTWTKITFTTECGSFNIPLSEDFETTSEYQLPLCWSAINAGAGSVYVVTNGQSTSGTNSIKMSWLDNNSVALLITPEISNPINEVYITYKAKTNNISSQPYITIGTIDDPNQENTFNPLYNHYLLSNFSVFEYYFNNYSGIHSYIALKISCTQEAVTEAFIDDISINILPSCIPPHTLNSQNINDNSATITWQNGNSETLWDLKYGTTGFDVYTQGILISSINSNSYILNGVLNSGTMYDVYVRADCGGGSTSTWVKTTFTTLCLPLTVPLVEDFDNTNLLNIPNCWFKIESDFAQIQTVDWGESVSGLNSLRAFKQIQDTALFISPELISDISALNISFNAKKANWVNNASILLGTITDPDNSYTFTSLQQFNLDNTYDEYIYYFNNYSGNDNYIAFKFITDDNSSEVFIDDITIDSLPDCIPPNTLSILNISDSSAQASWQSGHNETLWNLKYGLSGFDPNTQGININGLASSFYDFNNALNPNTAYDVYVQADCGSGQLSSWIFISFSTLCSSYPVPLDENFESTFPQNIPDCWSSLKTNNAEINVVDVSWHALNGTNSLNMIKQQQDVAIIITPELNPNIQSLYFSFHSKKQYYISDAVIILGTMSNPLDENTFSYVTQFTLENYYQDFEYYFHNYATSDRYIALKLETTDVYADIYIDDIHIDSLPSCIPPNNLTVSNITDNSAILNWQIGNFEFLWNMVYGFTGFDPYTQGTMVSGITSTTYDFNNTLSSSTTYDAYIQADCFGGDLSSWVKVSFSTLCASFSTPLIEDFENILHPELPACWGCINVNNALNETGNFNHASSGLNSLKLILNPNDVAYIVTPELVEDVNTLFLRFQAKKQQVFNPLNIVVGVIQDPTDMNTFDSLTFFNLSDNFQLYEYFFNNYNGTDKYIAFKIIGFDPNVNVYIDDVEIGVLPSCFIPVNLQITNITGNSAQLSWQAGNNETMWNLLYGETGFDPLTEGTLISELHNSTYDFNNVLNPHTTYDVYVQADCGGGDLSDWISESFTTLCLPFNVPVIESFETPNSEGIPDCWHKITTNWAQVEAANYGNATSGNNSLLLQMAQNDLAMIVTPEILPNINTLYLSFNAKKQAWITQANIIIGTLSQQDDTNSFSPLGNFNITDNFETYNYYFNNYGATDKFIALKLQTNENNAAVFIDDITIDLLPSCIPPDSLSAQNITLNTAELTWQASNSETLWQIEYGNENFIQGTGIFEVVTNDSLIINGLNEGTTYEFYVRAICDNLSGDTSSWSVPYTFTTACNIPQTPFIETFEGVFPPVCWQLVSGSGNWSAYPSAGGYGNSSRSAIANFYNIDGNVPFDLISLEFDALITDKPRLIFDFSYATFISEVDELQIFYSLNGGSTFSLLQNIPGGATGPLNTAGTSVNYFVPNAAQWATKVVELPQGTNKVNFKAKSSFGNNLYIDNVIICNNYEFVEDAEICAGDSYIWRGQTYSQQGLFYDSLLTEFGCDSVYVLNLLVSNYLPVDVSVISNPLNPVCSGAEVVFSAIPDNGGIMPIYEWKINGITQGTSNATFSTNTLMDNDTVVCILNSNAICYTGPLTVTDTMFMDVLPNPEADISIAASTGTTICEGTEVIFTATPVNGGSNPVFEWRINGNAIGTNSPTFTIDTLNPNDVVNCLMTSDELCVINSPVFSDALYMTVNPILPVSVSIEANPSYPVCKGTNIIFTATAVNGGTTPEYQWKINGVDVGNNNAVLSCDTLSDNDVVSCVLVSNAEPCAEGSPAVSNEISVTVYSLIDVDVTIEANSGNIICENDSVSFTATPINPGTSPVYQWEINGNDVGTNSNIFTTNLLQDGDIVTCILISSAFPCTTNNPATSNPIVMTVTPGSYVNISINADTLGPVCFGTPINFSAIPQNEGNNPVYQWKINNIDVGNNSPNFTCDTLTDNDMLNCVLLSDIITCPIGNPALSNTLTVDVNPILAVSVSINVSPSNIVCDSTLLTFTATTINPGSNPIYQWKLNGNDTGTNSPVFISDALQDGDEVSCVLTSDASPCETGNPATSNSILMQVNSKFYNVQSDTTCNGSIYSWRGNNYSISGTYYDSLLTTNACDSIYMLNLTVMPTFTQTESESICFGEVYNWHGNNYTAQGTYYDTLQTVYGCDSIFVLNLFTKPKFFFTESINLCDGDTLLWHGLTLTTTGNYFDSSLTILGCDSVYQLQLFSVPSYEFIQNDTICDGDDFYWRGNYYSSQGLYYDSLLTNQACDSLFILNLSVNPIYENMDSVVICNGESYNWQGNTYNTQGIYYDTLLTQYGCDSILSLKLTVAFIDVSVTENNAILTANTSGALYQWVDCDNYYAILSGETNQTFIPDTNGYYAVIITQNACTDTSDCYVVDNVSLNELSIEPKIEIYPNPNKGVFNLKSSENLHIIIYDLLGDILFENNFNEGLHTFDLKHFPNGIYILNAVGENTFVNRKIIIQK